MMWRLFARVIPTDLPLSPDERKRAVEEGRLLFRERGQRVMLWIGFYLTMFNAVLWIIATAVHAAGWPRWVVEAIFWPTLFVGLILFSMLRLKLGIRRAIFEALIRQGHKVCPRCGYPAIAEMHPFVCTECGADRHAERWDLITINSMERVRFRHIASDRPLPFAVRACIMDRAWRRVRTSRSGFVMYLWVGLMFLGAWISFGWGIVAGGVGIAVTLLNFVLLDLCCVRPAVRTEQRWVLADRQTAGTSP